VPEEWFHLALHKQRKITRPEEARISLLDKPTYRCWKDKKKTSPRKLGEVLLGSEAARRTLLGLIDHNFAAVYFGTIHLLNRFATGTIFEFDKAETAGAAGFTVLDDLGVGDITELGKNFAEAVGIDRPWEVANK
jgi:hypothetical protein